MRVYSLRRGLLRAFVMVFALVAVAHALDSDREQPATMQADDFTLDLAAGTRIYRGNVIFRQGSLRLRCAVLTTHHDQDGALVKGVCSGSPGTFAQRLESTQHQNQDARGQARTITLDRQEDVVLFEGGGEIEFGGQFGGQLEGRSEGNRIAGERIRYDLGAEKVTASGVAADRPRLVIQPRVIQPRAVGGGELTR